MKVNFINVKIWSLVFPTIGKKFNRGDRNEQKSDSPNVIERQVHVLPSDWVDVVAQLQG